MCGLPTFNQNQNQLNCDSTVLQFIVECLSDIISLRTIYFDCTSVCVANEYYWSFFLLPTRRLVKTMWTNKINCDEYSTK